MTKKYQKESKLGEKKLTINGEKEEEHWRNSKNKNKKWRRSTIVQVSEKLTYMKANKK